PLNPNEKIILTMGPDVHPGLQDWDSATFACDGTGIPFTLSFAGLNAELLFFPQNGPPPTEPTIPCLVTVKDLKGKQYKIILARPKLKTDPPTSPADDAQKSCAGITPLEILGWCNRTNGPNRVATDDPIKWGFSTPPVLPDNNT